MTAWQAAQVGLRRWISVFSRTVAGLPPVAAAFRSGTFGGGVAGGVPRMRSMIHAPRSTGAVRFGFAVSISTAPLPSRPKRFGSFSTTRWKPLPRTSVMP